MKELEQVKNKIIEFIEEYNHSRSLEVFKLLSKGKMLRSKLILQIAGINDESIKLCAIVEMIHAASLLHDDVIDDATTRRGQTSLNCLLGNSTSIMFGDILYSIAYTNLILMNKEIATTMSNAVVLLSIGELEDIELAKNFNSDLDKYFKMISNKTASLIEACTTCAAIISSKDKAKYALYGRNLGLAFQMIDDILDITQDSKTLGKPALSDFLSGKVTIPYLLLYERLDDKEKLKSLYKKELTTEELLWIKEQMINTNSLQDSIARAKDLGNEAIKILENENSPELIVLMKAMIERDF